MILYFRLADIIVTRRRRPWSDKLWICASKEWLEELDPVSLMLMSVVDMIRERAMTNHTRKIILIIRPRIVRVRMLRCQLRCQLQRRMRQRNPQRKRVTLTGRGHIARNRLVLVRIVHGPMEWREIRLLLLWHLRFLPL